MHKTQITYQKTSHMIAGLLFVLLLISGCANLQDIRKFADISAESATYTTFVEDFTKSAERQKNYQPPQYHAQLDAIVQQRKELQPRLIALHKGVEEYMNALGELASDKLISYDKSLDPLAANMQKILNKQQAEAFGALTKLLAKAVTDAYRQAQLKKIIEESNEHVQIIISALKDIIGKDYPTSLCGEIVAAKKCYNGIILTAKGTPQDAAIQLLHEKLQEKEDVIATKKQSALTYLEILDKIAKGHQALYDNRNKISSRQLLSTIGGYGTDISNLYNKLKALK